jgi:hypothetical protein
LAGQQALPTPLTVLVYNYRHAPIKTLASGEREAGGILAAAGVLIRWVNCPLEEASAGHPREFCAGPSGAAVVKLGILPGRAHNNFLETMSGVAVAPSLAGVYYDYIPRLQFDENSESNSAVILGCVMAHEIGHLLLGSYGHSVGGIMQPQWRTEELHLALMGKLRFSPRESKLMQAESRARIDLDRIALSSKNTP